MVAAVSPSIQQHLPPALDNPVQPKVEPRVDGHDVSQSDYEQSAAAALLGLYASCLASPLPSQNVCVAAPPERIRTRS